ncbi:terpenoid cyclases/protein prenyltransferase alpha-alpha toroid [Kalaharituber pfeilii]|nr:terpenoid cyclases/protein prenyltransferase alpha-alpha toroid [Kalaharituber pfeilii]
MAPASDATVGKTDYARWRMKSDHGRQTWHYLQTEEEMKEWPQTIADKHYLGLDTGLPDLPPPKTPLDAAKNGIEFFSKLQVSSGNWACEYPGPLFLTPGFIITMYITNTPIPQEWKTEVIRYLAHRTNPHEGGWGLHVEGESTVFGTAMNYVVLRICGMDKDHPIAAKARKRLHEMGGALYSPHWGKIWLSLLNLYKWEGLNPVIPELWVLPKWVPFHPWRWWIHCRMVYLPISYLYNSKYYHPVNDLILSLRKELYTQDFDSIDFSRHRNSVSEIDVYYPHTTLLNVLNGVLVAWGKVCPKFVQEYAIRAVKDLVVREDEDSEYVCLGPVNNPLNFLVRYLDDGPRSHAVQMHRKTLEDYMWLNKEGMFVNGTDGLQVWDTSFWVQAVVETGIAQREEYREMLVRALEFLEDQQIRENCRDQHNSYRHIRKGAWPFSKRLQGYTVSDCTAEALKAVLLLQRMPEFPKLLSDQRLYNCIDVLLSIQSSDGGFSEYETSRVGDWIEHLNAAEVFGNIMKSYSVPECTTAVVTALTLFSQMYGYKKDEIESAVKRALNFVKKIQRKDGSWYGSWGICFTYAAMFAMEALEINGESYDNSPHVRRAVHFLLEKQMTDGGWGESYKSSSTGVYHHHEKSQVCNTAYACIALMHSGYPHRKPVERGLKLIMSRQKANGEWEQEAIEGVFNRNCMIAYPNYKFIFTVKALGMFAKKYGDFVLWEG